MRDDVKHYLLSVHQRRDEPLPETTEIDELYRAVAAFNEELQASGSWVFAGGLQPVAESTVVDATGSETLRTDGPFAETKEYLGGFWIITAADREAALAVAGRASRACRAPVEVRPFQDPD